METFERGTGSSRRASLMAIIAFFLTLFSAVNAQERFDGIRVHRAQQTGGVSFIKRDDGRSLAVEPTVPGQRATAADFLRTYGHHFGVRDVATELRPPVQETDRLGFRRTTYKQIYRGVPVFSGLIRIHQNPAGAFTAANGRFYKISPTLNPVPSIDRDAAVRIATADLAVNVNPEVEQMEVVIVDPAWYGDPPAGVHLAYYVILTDLSVGVREAFFIDAHAGKVLDRWTLLESFKSRSVFDDLQGITVRVEGGPPTGDSDADAAYDYSGDTYDYLFRAFGRDGIDGVGGTMNATVHLQSPSCPNAFGGSSGTWYCTGLVTDDIVAHEFAHGLTALTAGLIYQNQSGQLNESFSDVIGEIVDLLNGDASFAGPPGGTPWPPHDTGPGSDTPNGPRVGCVAGTLMTVEEPPSIAGDYLAQPAFFGPQLSTMDVSENLVVADPIRACTIDGPFLNAGDMPGKIVLVRRGECLFTEKVKNAQDAGAAAVVVANNVFPGLSPMGGSDGTIVIPSVGISQADGDMLIAEAEMTKVGLTLRENDNPDMRWLIGEDATAFSGAIRDMWLPSCKGHPDTANHPFQTCNPNDNGGVHSGSGVPNHAFAMLTDGKSFNGYSVSPIGLFKAGAVWYRALTVYLTPTSDFQDAYFAINQSAADLIDTMIKDPRDGSDFELFTAADAAEVDKALLAVEMHTTGLCGAANVLSPAPATLCPGRTTLYTDDFESGPNGWTVSHSGPSGPPTPYDWEQTGGLPLGRQGIAWFAANPSIGNCGDQDESAVHSLFSPVINLPGELELPYLLFSHYVETEALYDGGNIKISVNSGPWTLIPRQAFEHNPYNGGLRSTGNTNPMAGEEAWSGTSADGADWGDSLVDLSSLASAGDSVQFRFDFGKDGCSGVEGWYVDDFELLNCPENPVFPPPGQEPGGANKNRFISFVVPGDFAGTDTALRVELVQVGMPPGAPAGRQFRYVTSISGPGGPLTCSDDAPLFSDYACARLGCEPEYRDWGGELGGQVLHVTGAAVVPASIFSVVHIAESCGSAPDADSCDVGSANLELATAVWGDLTGGSGMPDGFANVLDISTIVDKLKGLESSLYEPQVWLKDAMPNPASTSVNVLDLALVVEGVKGIPYLYAIDVCP